MEAIQRIKHLDAVFSQKLTHESEFFFYELKLFYLRNLWILLFDSLSISIHKEQRTAPKKKELIGPALAITIASLIGVFPIKSVATVLHFIFTEYAD